MRGLRRRLLPIAVLATLAGVAGCGSDDASSSTAPAGAATTAPGSTPLEATTWELTSGSLTLVGNWTVTGYLASSGSAFASVVTGSELTAQFAADGTVNGNAGCNTFRGGFTQAPGDATTIGPLASTRKACADEALTAQETAFMTALESSTTAEVASHEAALFNSGGQRTVMMTR